MFARYALLTTDALLIGSVLGATMFLGSWLEGGSAFDEWEHLTWSTNLSLGVIADTIIGPVFGGFSFGFEGGTRFYIAIGQLFR